MSADLGALHLDSGSHEAPTDGMCLMEAVAWVAHEPHSDHPACVSPVLGAYGRRLNDALPAGKRQQLKQFIPQFVGTAGDGLDEQRSYLALDWLIRTYTPAWLGLVGLADEAGALRDLKRIVDLEAAQAAGPVVRAGQKKAAAAWDAAGDAAQAAAWDAAWDAAGAAAWDAARAAAWAAARAAAWAAARAAAWDAARAAAWDAAGAAAWAAAGDAARAALRPTVDTLQRSAIDLFAAMIRPEVVQ